MIRELFLPSSLAGRYIISQRVVGIDVARTYVSASQVYLHDKSITIEKCINEPLEIGNTTNYEERVITALKAIKPQLDKYNTIRTTIPSSTAIIKEITLPFTQPEKIKMVLEYEIEPLLPFSLNDAIVDGIITKIIPEENKALVLVAAVPKEHIAHHLELLRAADLDPDIISIDFFDLYELCRMIPAYAADNQSVVIIDLESHSTRIGYLYNGALRIVRTLPKGLVNQVKSISETLGMQPSAVMEQVIRHGFDHTDKSFTDALKESLDAFWNDIAFTLTSFTAQSDKKIDTILLLGSGADIQGFPGFITEKTGVACQKLEINQITLQKNIIFKQNGTISQACMLSLAAALNPANAESFNLRRKEFASKKIPLFMKQLITAGILSCLLVFGFVGYIVYELASLHSELGSSTEELSNDIKEKLQITAEGDRDLKGLISDAETKVNGRKQLVEAFSGGQRASFLQCLDELATVTLKDRNDLGFNLKRLTIADHELTLTGSVQNDSQLNIFQRRLQTSKFFDYKGKIQLPEFDNLKIPLNTRGNL